MQTIPTIGQPWPAQGGIYIGSRLKGGEVHHIIIPGGVETDVLAVEFDDAAKAVSATGEINGHSDWRLPDQEDLMLTYVNARQHFKTDGDWLETAYWTSTPYGECLAWAVHFSRGDVDYWLRSHEFRVRPFRSIIDSAL